MSTIRPMASTPDQSAVALITLASDPANGPHFAELIRVSFAKDLVEAADPQQYVFDTLAALANAGARLAVAFAETIDRPVSDILSSLAQFNAETDPQD